MLVQKEVRKSIWISFELGNSVFQVFFHFVLFENIHHNVVQLFTKSFFVLSHTLANMCKGNCSHFLGWPACPNVDCERASENKSTEKLDHRSCASPCQTWSLFIRGTKESSPGMGVWTSTVHHWHPAVDICNDQGGCQLLCKQEQSSFS